MTTAVFQPSRNLLLQSDLPPEQIRNLLAPVGFENWEQAHRCLQRIAEQAPEARDALAESLPALLMTLSQTTGPDRILTNLERLIQSAPQPEQLLRYLTGNPRGFEILVTLFRGSQFLTEILLRNPAHFEPLTDPKRLAQPKSAAQLQQEAQQIIEPFLAEIPATGHDPSDIFPAMDALRRFQRRELLRIGVCDLLGLLDLITVTSQLSHLADSLVEACLILAGRHTQTDPHAFTVLAMGKLGGGEINYSSDIDLIFLAAEEAHRYIKMGQKLIDAIGKITEEGFLYRVDMRLRPWGRSGALVYTVEGYLAYLHKHAGLWEKQALLKARPIAGNKALGREFLSQARPLIFSAEEATLRVEIHRLKQRIEEQLRQKGREWGEVKLGQGSIRDVEFVTQYLQLVHGQAHPHLHTPTTLEALSELYSLGLLPPDEYRVLNDGYIFLRTVEHHLQLMHYRQIHTLPDDLEALTHLARRLHFEGPEAGENFRARYLQHSAAIRAVYQRHLAAEDTASGQAAPPAPPDLLPLVTRMHPSYVLTFSETDIEQHARLLERLDQTDKLVEIETKLLEDEEHWQLTIVGYDYLGELSLICGLLFVYGLNIVDGHVYTYGPDPAEDSAPRRRSRSRPAGATSARKIVDVFTVRPVQTEHLPAPDQERWTQYVQDLAALCRRLQHNEQREAQGELAKRVATVLPHIPDAPNKLYPVTIEIDNEASDRHTVLRISSVDTVGFLYEFTNALALTGVNVRRMTVASAGERVQDILYVTNAQRQKITSPQKQRELRVATVLIKHFTHLLPRSPNPESALLHFREFIGRLFMRPNWPDEIASLEQPEVLSALARLLGVSDFLWNDFLRMQHANLFPLLKDTEALVERPSRADLREALAIELQKAPPGQRRETLNAFKDREMFRIDMRQIEGQITEFGQFSTELTELAEVIVTAAYRLAAQELREMFGLPRLSNGRECPMSICALGKCGGAELGFASDIELMFIFAGNGRTTGPRVTTTGEFFEKLAQEVDRAIQSKREGIFELDLRLRPYGQAGSLAVSQESFQNYFGPEGDAWPYERQALVKLRPIAADLRFGQELVRVRDGLVYTGEPFDVAAMRAMRERQLRHLVTPGSINAKFSPGALVDVEYLVQGLQISHGHQDPSLRHPNTGGAMQALAAAGLIPTEDYPRLRAAHIFLRNLINALRMVRGNAKDLTVPAPDEEEFGFLARRLDYSNDPGRLKEDLSRHTRFVQDLNQRLLG